MKQADASICWIFYETEEIDHQTIYTLLATASLLLFYRLRNTNLTQLWEWIRQIFTWLRGNMYNFFLKASSSLIFTACSEIFDLCCFEKNVYFNLSNAHTNIYQITLHYMYKRVS